MTTDPAWIDAALTSARPKAVAALLRYFRDLDTAEEAFQDASLRALKAWPDKGPPRDPAAWLIMVGRNAAFDHARRNKRLTTLPDEDQLSDLEDAETRITDGIDQADYRDDILRLLFICCHPDLPATQQIALALRIVSGLSVRQIARAFLVQEKAMEQRITRAKAKVAAAGIAFDTPDAHQRAERLNAVLAMIYLVFNEGYSASGEDRHERLALCDEAIRLGRLVLRMYPGDPEVMGLSALMLLQHSRSAARFDADGQFVLLEDQDRAQWDGRLTTEGMALVDKAVRHESYGIYAVQAAIAAVHARARTATDTNWRTIDALYAALERINPSPVVTLNRAVAVSKAEGAETALIMIEPLDGPLDNYFHYHGVRGALLKQVGRHAEAREAFGRAIALARSASEAAHIRIHLDALDRETGREPALHA